MKPILVLYGTTEGHTRKIAEFIAERLRRVGKTVDLVDSATPAATQVAPIYAGAIVGGSVHYDKHPASLAHFIKANVAWLNTIPTAFFSVSLATAHRDAQSRAEARKQADQFIDETGLAPGMVWPVAGALKFTQYDFFKRYMVRSIAKQIGGDSDIVMSRDTEYTDWNELGRCVDEYLAAAQIDGRKAA